ncbi:MAG: hypothetical protein P8Y47_06260 [Alphaproteobacteria bacterium]
MSTTTYSATQISHDDYNDKTKRLSFLKWLSSIVLTENGIALFVFGLLPMIPLGPVNLLAHYFAVRGGDALHNTWTWGRNLANLLHFQSPFLPNIMFPDANSSAYAEIGVGDTAIYSIVYAITGYDAAGYAVIFYLSFALTGYFAFKVARAVGADAIVAALAGMIAAFIPYRFGHAEHAQILTLFWALIPLYCMIRYLQGGARKYLVLLGISLLPVCAGPSYNLVILGVLTIAVLGSQISIAMQNSALRERIVKLCMTYGGAFIITSPIWYVYARLYFDGYMRSSSHNDIYKVDLAHLFVPSSTSAIYHKTFSFYMTVGKLTVSSSVFFSGFVILGLLLFAAIYLRRTLREHTDIDVQNRNFIIAFAALAIFFVAIALGKTITWNGLYVFPNPIFRIVTKTPLLAATRYIAHFVYPALICGGFVAAFVLSRRWPNSTWRTVGVVAMCIGILIETRPDYEVSRTRRVPDPPMPKVYNFLATLPPREGVIFLPFPRALGTGDAFHRQFQYMRYANVHRLWMVNGTTGFFPKPYREATGAFQKFPSQKAYQWAAKTRLRYIVLDRKAKEFPRVNEPAIGKDCAAFTKLYDDGDYAVLSIDAKTIETCAQMKKTAARTASHAIDIFLRGPYHARRLY